MEQKLTHSADLDALARSAADGVRSQEQLTRALFDELRTATTKGSGIFRDAYGEGENFAHRLMEQTARTLGLAVARDAAANTYMTLSGRNRGPCVLVGSHLDSVADGGNYDGAAGVIAGLVAVAALKAAGVVPARDITVMGIRAEESVWFASTYLGSRAALGIVPEGALDRYRRADTGKTFREHLVMSGGSPQRLFSDRAYLSPANVSAFLELHIEQGPLLEAEGLPVGIVTGVRGNFRLPAIRIRGEYSHCGGVPRDYRRDCVVAGADFVHALDVLWQDWEQRGKDMAFTVGKFFTDAAQHALTKIPGEATLSLDVRSVDADLLAELESQVRAIARAIEERRGVTFELGGSTRAEVGRIEPRFVTELDAGARALGIACRKMASGASHDAAAMAQAGIATGMIFVRNANGSHNPLEHMEIADFLEATRLLTWWLVRHGAA